MDKSKNGKSDCEKNTAFFREDITAVFAQWRPVIQNQIRKDYRVGRVGKQTAIAYQQVVAQAEGLLLHIADLGLTPRIVMDWLDREMELCEELAAYKEPFEPQNIITKREPATPENVPFDFGK